ncbi:MAG: cytochrome c biogenesis protein CcsA [Cyclobacteriaceae bacterium]
MYKSWWKVLAVVLLIYTIVGGFLLPVPRKIILNESIRALHFHVPMWWGMILLLLASVVYAIKSLRSNNPRFDIISNEFANTGIVFGVLGLLTGILWSKFTWITQADVWWSNDPKQNASTIGLLIYLAYKILRTAIPDQLARARISGVYNIFAFACLIPLLFILPRMTDSLHPGNGGNPGFNIYDLDSDLRKVFYIAGIAWTMFGVWITTLRIRMKFIEHRRNEVI